jgi:hypothetical protein
MEPFRYRDYNTSLSLLNFGPQYYQNEDVELDRAEYQAKLLLQYKRILLSINHIHYNIINNILTKINQNEYYYSHDHCYVTKIDILIYDHNCKLYIFCNTNKYNKFEFKHLLNKDELELFLVYLFYNNYITNVKTSYKLFEDIDSSQF